MLRRSSIAPILQALSRADVVGYTLRKVVGMCCPVSAETLRAEGFELERVERAKLGIVEQVAARKPP